MGRLFGTNGVRGVVGDTMTPELALRLGRAIGTWADAPVLVGRDTRDSGMMLSRALFAGIASTGTDAVDANVVPTPAVQYAVRDPAYGGGVIVTASHNPPEFNGIKVVAPDGTELGPDDEARIEKLYFEEAFEVADWSKVGSVSRDLQTSQRYIDAIVAQIGEGSIAQAAPRVLLDPANGAACAVTLEVLDRLGAKVTTINGEADGSFPGHPSEPTPENLAGTIATVREGDYDLGIVLDGDADRCVFITHDGGYVPGERSLALVAGAKVEAAGGGLVVTPVSSSACVEDHVRAKGGEVLYTAVGSPIVARAMMAKEALFGGEENGGLIFPEHQYCRDGTMTAAWVAAHVANSGRSLADLLDEIPRYTLVKRKMACPADRREAVMEALPGLFPDARVETIDGVKAFSDEGWTLVRPSGTEPLVRVFAEARDEATATRMADEVEAMVKRLLGAERPKA